MIMNPLHRFRGAHTRVPLSHTCYSRSRVSPWPNHSQNPDGAQAAWASPATAPICLLKMQQFEGNAISFPFFSFLFNFIYLFIYLFLAVLGLRCCARAFSSCGKRGPLFIAMRGPLTIAASLVAEHRLQTRRLSNCGSRAQLLRGTWDLPRPGLDPVSPALAGRLATTEPPGKPCNSSFF